MLSGDDRPRGYRGWLWVWIAYLGLLTAGIPWYWPKGEVILWLGMPAWLVTAVAASTAASLLTAVVLGRRWPGEDDPPGGGNAW
jgi:hypothetical protein